MAYCIQNGSNAGDIAPAKISIDQLKQITSEDSLSVVQGVVDAAIAEADSDIDSYAGRRYAVPFNPVPAKVKQLSVAIAVYKLFEKRINQLGGEIPESTRDMYDDAMSFLKDVSKGNAVIDGAISPPANTKNTGGYVQNSTRVFGQESLDKL